MNERLIEKLLEKLLLGETDTTSQSNDSFIGKYVIVRGYYAGVRCGKLLNETKGNIILEDARMLWRRWCKKSIGLSWLATYGLADRDEVKVLATQKKIKIKDERVSTFFECSPEIEKQLREWKVAEQS